MHRSIDRSGCSVSIVSYLSRYRSVMARTCDITVHCDNPALHVGHDGGRDLLHHTSASHPSIHRQQTSAFLFALSLASFLTYARSFEDGDEHGFVAADDLRQRQRQSNTSTAAVHALDRYIEIIAHARRVSGARESCCCCCCCCCRSRRRSSRRSTYCGSCPALEAAA